MSEKHFLKTVKWGVIPIINYRGVEVIKTTLGYTVLRKNVTTPEDVDEIIDSATETLKKTIK